MTIVEEGVSSVYAAPGQRGAIAEYRPRYGHYIGGEFVEPVDGEGAFLDIDTPQVLEVVQRAAAPPTQPRQPSRAPG